MNSKLKQCNLSLIITIAFLVIQSNNCLYERFSVRKHMIIVYYTRILQLEILKVKSTDDQKFKKVPLILSR